MNIDIGNIRDQVKKNSVVNPFEFNPTRIGADIGQELVLPTEEASDQVVNDLQTKVAELKVENLELRVQFLEEKGMREAPTKHRNSTNVCKDRFLNSGRQIEINNKANNPMMAKCDPAAAQNNTELGEARAELDVAKQELASLKNPEEAGAFKGEKPSSEELTEELFSLIEENKQLQVDNKQLEFDILTKELSSTPPSPCGGEFEDSMVRKAEKNDDKVRTRSDIQRDLSIAERELNEAIANQKTNTSDDLRTDMAGFEGSKNDDIFYQGYGGRMLISIADSAITDSKFARESYLSDKIDKLEATIVDNPIDTKKAFPMARCEEQDNDPKPRADIAEAQQELDSLRRDLGL